MKPHGGTLVSKIIDKKDEKKILMADLPRLAVENDIVLDIEKIAIGAYSPLKGFMNKDDIASVVDNMRLSDGTSWTIPVFLSVKESDLSKIPSEGEIIIQDPFGKDVALMRIDEIFSFSKSRWAQKVYGTESRKHPGVKRLFDIHGKLLAGEIWLLDSYTFKFDDFNLTPMETRDMIKKRKWKRIAGFQTRNAPHRAHEYLQKIALSVTDGILLQPIIGWKKDGDFLPELVIEAYKILVKNYFPRNSAILTGLAAAMRYAGPREAVFHAIVRKNYGCTHFIVGRDHAGVGDFYDKYAAHRIFDKFPGLGIEPLLLRGPYYCRRCEEVVSDKICCHSEKWQVQISGTMVRESLIRGKDLPGYIMRKEVFDVLKDKGKDGFI